MTTVALTANLSGYFVKPNTVGKHPAVLVMMDFSGLSPYVKSECDRLAQAGFAALAVDYYHGEVFAPTDKEGASAKLATLVDDICMAETATGLAFLAAQSDVQADAIGVIGFCMGGRLAFLANLTFGAKLKATVSFYGGGIAPAVARGTRPSLLARVGEVHAPALLVYGAKDAAIAPDEIARLSEALTANNKRFAISVYPDAGHAFATVGRESYRAADAESAWREAIRFFRANLG